jgi:molybdenum-dependent DNA-binding transcriptional regulator ModE
MRGSYISKSEPKIVNLINLMQKFEHLSIREAAIKIGLSYSTAARKIKEWNEMTNGSDQGGVPDTISPKEHKGRRLILKDVHTVFIFEMLANEPTLTVEAVTDQLCENFKKFKLPPRSVATHMKKRCSLTYKRIVRNISHETVRRQ